jgi:hypothetical protein
MADAVFFAAIIPASRATASTSPFFSELFLIASRVIADILIAPVATATRADGSFELTSTIRARPLSSV